MKAAHRPSHRHALRSIVLLTLLSATVGSSAQTSVNQPVPPSLCTGWVGLQVKAESRTPTGTITGIEVCAVFVGGPAESAGLKAGDVIIEIDGDPVWFASDSEMLTAFSSHCPGHEIGLTVEREDGTFLSLKITVEEIPSGLRAEWQRQRELAEQRSRAKRSGAVPDVTK